MFRQLARVGCWRHLIGKAKTDMSRIVVTGAAGFIGSHVTEALLRRGDEVVGIDSFDSFYDPALKRANLATALKARGFTLCEGDIRDAKFVGDTIDAGGGCVLPALIDCHTHTVFAGTREAEFVQRIEGESYARIAETGGGIKVTVEAVRSASCDELVELALPR